MVGKNRSRSDKRETRDSSPTVAALQAAGKEKAANIAGEEEDFEMDETKAPSEGLGDFTKNILGLLGQSSRNNSVRSKLRSTRHTGSLTLSSQVARTKFRPPMRHWAQGYQRWNHRRRRRRSKSRICSQTLGVAEQVAAGARPPQRDLKSLDDFDPKLFRISTPNPVNRVAIDEKFLKELLDEAGILKDQAKIRGDATTANAWAIEFR